MTDAAPRFLLSDVINPRHWPECIKLWPFVDMALLKAEPNAGVIVFLYALTVTIAKFDPAEREIILAGLPQVLRDGLAAHDSKIGKQ